MRTTTTPLTTPSSSPRTDPRQLRGEARGGEDAAPSSPPRRGPVPPVPFDGCNVGLGPGRVRARPSRPEVRASPLVEPVGLPGQPAAPESGQGLGRCVSFRPQPRSNRSTLLRLTPWRVTGGCESPSQAPVTRFLATWSVARYLVRCGAGHRAQRPKRGLADEDILHAFRNPIRVFEVDDGMTMFIGADHAGRLLEVGWVTRPQLRIVHAMPCPPETSS